MASCCENCFNDKFLKDYIKVHGSIEDCDYCGSSGVLCIAVSSLTDLFDPVIDLYEPLEKGIHHFDDDNPSDFGDSLVQLINDDWQTFSDELIESGPVGQLLEDIVNATREPKESIDTSGLWISKDRAFTSSLPDDRWEEFSDYIKRERRFILSLPEYDDPREWLQHRFLLSEFTKQSGFCIFRARMGCKGNEKGEKIPFDAIEMAPPPPEKTPAGRANPPGIPFLYTALDQPTAVAEIRPWKGALVSVAKFILTRAIVIIDLANIPPLETPFGIENLNWVLESRQMLSILGEKLCTPIDPQVSEIEYVPTQYITELIRDLRYHGILYKSALGPNNNLVLFDPNSARVESVELVHVVDLQYTIEPYRPHYD